MTTKIIINPEKNEMSFTMDTRIYNHKSILKSKEEFKQICDIDVKTPFKEIPVANPKYSFTVIIKPKTKLKENDMENLVYEFFNHTLNWEKILRTG